MESVEEEIGMRRRKPVALFITPGTEDKTHARQVVLKNNFNHSSPDNSPGFKSKKPRVEPQLQLVKVISFIVT